LLNSLLLLDFQGSIEVSALPALVYPSLNSSNETLAKFRQVRRQIEARVKAWIANSQ
jgi:hypothetical protein